MGKLIDTEYKLDNITSHLDKKYFNACTWEPEYLKNIEMKRCNIKIDSNEVIFSFKDYSQMENNLANSEYLRDLKEKVPKKEFDLLKNTFI